MHPLRDDVILPRGRGLCDNTPYHFGVHEEHWRKIKSYTRSILAKKQRKNRHPHTPACCENPGGIRPLSSPQVRYATTTLFPKTPRGNRPQGASYSHGPFRPNPNLCIPWPHTNITPQRLPAVRPLRPAATRRQDTASTPMMNGVMGEEPSRGERSVRLPPCLIAATRRFDVSLKADLHLKVALRLLLPRAHLRGRGVGWGDRVRWWVRRTGCHQDHRKTLNVCQDLRSHAAGSSRRASNSRRKERDGKPRTLKGTAVSPWPNLREHPESVPTSCG